MTRVLVVNAGSSSIKLAVVDEHDRVVDDEHIREWRGDTEALRGFLERAEFDAVGHRVVHGGWDLVEPVLIDDHVEAQLRAASPLAPLHQGRALDGIGAVRELLPACPEVACFDTTFHRNLPRAAATYPVPAEWRRGLGVHRFGSHGLNHAYVAGRAAAMLGRDIHDLRTVSAHLGSGASLCAIDRGLSVDTTMGFTPLEGLMMSTRSGSLDPGILLWLMTERGMSGDEISEALYRRSGLRGVSELSGDLQQVAAAADEGSDEAALAVEVYVHRLVGGIAAMVAALGGLDVLVFTGGVGENAAWLRRRACERLGFLGLGVDPGSNAAARPDADVSAAGSDALTLVVAAREDLEVARETRRVVAERPGRPPGTQPG